jgi:hypothetical protein
MAVGRRDGSVLARGDMLSAAHPPERKTRHRNGELATRKPIDHKWSGLFIAQGIDDICVSGLRRAL